MKKRLAVFFGFIFILSFCFFCISYAKSVAKPVKYEFLESTAVVHIISEGDGSNNSCTVDEGFCMAVAFSKNGRKYQFFTAAHCVADYSKETRKTILKESILQLVLEKSNGDESIYEAKVLDSKEKGPAVGEMKNFEDLAILEAEINEDIPIMPLSESRPELGEDVLVIAGPVGLANLGLLQLRGYVSKEKMINLTIDGSGIKAEGAYGIQVIGLGLGFGGSGAGVFSPKRGEIVGIVTGTTFNPLGHISLVVTPITIFNNFRKEYTEGKRSLAKKEQIGPKQGDSQNSCIDPNWCPLQKK